MKKIKSKLNPINLDKRHKLNDHLTNIKYLTDILEGMTLNKSYKKFSMDEVSEAQTLADNIILNADIIVSRFNNRFDQIEDLERSEQYESKIQGLHEENNVLLQVVDAKDELIEILKKEIKMISDN